MKRNLTDRLLKSLSRRPAPKGQTYDVTDSGVPGLAIRVSERGHLTFVLIGRYPGRDNPTRRALGTYGAISLEQARTKARAWHALLDRGIDPADHEERQRLAELLKRENSFAALVEDYIGYIKRKKLRTATSIERDLRRLVKRWGSRPVADIGHGDVARLIEQDINRSGKYPALRTFALLGRLFGWAIGVRGYGIAHNPVRDLT